MSSGRGGYRVVSAAEIERRRRVAAEARFRRACDEVERVERDIAAAVSAFGDVDVDLPKVVQPRDTSAAEVEQAAAVTEAAARTSAAGYESAVARARSRAIAGSITKARRSKLTDNAARERAQRIAARQAAEAAAAEATAEADAAAETHRARMVEARQEEVERVLGRLPASLDDSFVESARSAADTALAAALAADDPGYARGVERLRMEVQLAQDAARTRRVNLAAVERLRGELDGLDGTAATAARARLDAIDPGVPLPSDLAAAVGRAADAARAERDRAFVVDAMAETLGDLGYAVAPGFAADVAERGAVVQLPWSDAHGVQVREHRGHLLFNVVRYDDGSGATADAVADVRAEQRFCSDYDRLVTVARQRGIGLDLAPPAPAGDRPLQEVPLPRGASSSRRRDHDGERDLDARHRERER